jgi:hypothetical protein
MAQHAKNSYAQKLKDPRWQKKRLEILERDGWTCQCCGSDTKDPVEEDKYLVVHHFQYNFEPWDSEDEDLVTLCNSCHADFHELKSGINSKLFSNVGDLEAKKELASSFLFLLMFYEFEKEETSKNYSVNDVLIQLANREKEIWFKSRGFENG